MYWTFKYRYYIFVSNGHIWHQYKLTRKISVTCFNLPKTVTVYPFFVTWWARDRFRYMIINGWQQDEEHLPRGMYRQMPVPTGGHVDPLIVYFDFYCWNVWLLSSLTYSSNLLKVKVVNIKVHYTIIVLVCILVSWYK